MNKTKTLTLDQLLDLDLTIFGGVENNLETVIHAGHYALFLDLFGNPLDPSSNSSIPQDIADIFKDFSDFSELTWKLGLRFKSQSMGRLNIKLLTLVNDWQFLRLYGDSSKKKKAVGKELNLIRKAYYEVTNQLPSFLQQIEGNTINKKDIHKYKDGQWLFSEHELRESLNLTITDIYKNIENTGLEEKRNAKGDKEFYVSSITEEFNDKCILSSGSTDCSGEIIELIIRLYNQGVKLFINLYPKMCIGFVDSGTKIAMQLFSLKGMNIVNIAIPSQQMLLNNKESIILDHYKI